MLSADFIAEPCEIFSGSLHIAIFMPAFQVGGTYEDVIVDMMLINVCGDDVGITITSDAPCQFHSDCVRFFRSNLSGFESLPDMIGDHLICV